MPTMLSHIVITARDVDKMAAFYRDVMGLKITHQNGSNMVFLTSDPAREDHEIGIFRGRGEGDSDVLSHFCWRVDSTQEAKDFYLKFKANNVPIDETVIYAYPWGQEATVSIYFRDPEDNHVEIQAFVALDPEIPDRTSVLIDFEQDVDTIAAKAARLIEAPKLAFGGGRQN